MTVRAATALDLAWAHLRSGVLFTQGVRGVAAETKRGTLAGVVAFDGWTPASCQMHVALAAPGACRGLLRAAFAFPFVEARREVVRATIPAHNTRSLRLATHLGFEVRHRTVDGWQAGVDLVHLELRRADCRYLDAPLRRAA